MSLSCDPNDLIAGAKCFQCAIPEGMMPAVQTYLLANIAGITDIPALLADAKCFFAKIPPGMQGPVDLYLLCQIANK